MSYSKDREETMRDFVVRLFINSVALYVAIVIMNGNGIAAESMQWYGYVVLGLIFGILNAVIKPIIKFLTCPLIALTLGLFTLVINTAMFYAAGWLGETFTGFGFVVETFWGAFFGGLIVSVVSVILTLFLGETDDARKRRKRKQKHD
jgi:putative membrane protein